MVNLSMTPILIIVSGSTTTADLIACLTHQKVHLICLLPLWGLTCMRTRSVASSGDRHTDSTLLKSNLIFVDGSLPANETSHALPLCSRAHLEPGSGKGLATQAGASISNPFGHLGWCVLWPSLATTKFLIQSISLHPPQSPAMDPIPTAAAL